MKKQLDNQRFRQSKQRQRMLELLRSSDTHPTADWLYEHLKKEFHHLSLGTVYRNLAILAVQGFVQKIDFGSTFYRFEARVAPHYHLICEHCRSVEDFEMPIYAELNEQANELTDFTIQRHRIEFYGLCQKCKKKKIAHTKK